MSGGVVSNPSIRDRVPDVDDWGIVSRTIGGGGFVIADQIRPPSAAVTAVARTTISTTFLAAFAGRFQAFIHNNSNGILFVKLGPGASTTSFTTRITRQGFYEVEWPTYLGIITGVWSTAGVGDAQITETF